MEQSTIKNCTGSLSGNISMKTGPVLEVINCSPVANQLNETSESGGEEEGSEKDVNAHVLRPVARYPIYASII